MYTFIWFQVFQPNTNNLGNYIISSNYCYATICPEGLQSAVCSRQFYQLKQGTHVGCGLLTLFNITDITNSLAEPHFKATRWVLGELLKYCLLVFSFRLWDLMAEPVLQLSRVSLGEYSLFLSPLSYQIYSFPVICLLFTSAWIQQDKFGYTLIVCSLTWDFVESFLSSFFYFRYWAAITRW